MVHISQLRACIMGLIAFLFICQISAQNKEDTSRDVPINLAQITSTLAQAPMEFSQEAQTKPLTLNLPLPSGGERPFKVVESPIMAADFAALYPNFKTYGLVALDNPAVTGRMTITPYGLNAMIFLESGTMGIRARDLMNPKVHQVYFGKGDDMGLTGNCQFDETVSQHTKQVAPLNTMAHITNGSTRRTYRFAVVTTGEFEDANGNSTASASAVVVSSVNAIQAIFDRDLSVRFILLTPFIFSDPATDDFDPASGISRTQMAAQSVATRFASNTYDIGHVLHDQDQTPALHSGGGVAGLGVVCSAAASGTGFRRAAGWSGSFNNTSAGWYGLFAHEVGHMFNMPHTFNGSSAGNCGTGNLSASTAYEIGSGTSLMSYNGLCDAAQNIPASGTADDYFHANSLDKAVTFMNTISCQTSVSSGNAAPVVNPNPCGGAYSIPMATPFTLTGSGTDANGDVIYYSWEQYDEDGFVNDNIFNQAQDAPTHGFIGATAAASPLAPLFRSYPPTTNPSRTFPIMTDVVANNYATSFEPLPTVARTLNFRLTGRDYNSNGGGIHSTDLAVTVSGAAFAVTAPNTAVTLNAGNTTTVTWDIGGTAGYCTLVNIKLSTDGGFTYPYTLESGTANDGTQLVTLPAGLVNSTTARIKVEQASNTCVVFFDISNTNFSIASACNAPSTSISSITPLTTTAGNASLNLGLTNNIGSLMTSPISGSISGTETITSTVKASVVCGTLSCTAFSGVAATFDVYEFYVSVGGTYTFTTNYTFQEALAIYSGTFSTSSQCGTSLLGSSRCHNAPNTITGTNSTISVTLAPNQKYSLAVSNFFFGTTTGNYQISFTIPSGGGLYTGVPLPTGYAYTYAAVNSSTNNVTAVNSSSNFTTLPAGSYQIYGVTYYTGAAAPNPATPASWVGNSLTSVLGGSTCQLISSNAKPITVTSVLAVDLLNFEAKLHNKQVTLNWQTATEINNSHFIIQKSKDGQKFVDIGSVKGHGTTSTPQYYDFVDGTPYSGLNYYRLQQFDKDGKMNYSKIVSVLTGSNKEQEVKIYPNPTQNILTVEHATTTESFDVLNALGQVVKTIQTKPEAVQTTILTNDLDNGIYFLRIHSVNGLDKAVKTIRFVKL